MSPGKRKPEKPRKPRKRSRVPPPGRVHKDRRKEAERLACREWRRRRKRKG